MSWALASDKTSPKCTLYDRKLKGSLVQYKSAIRQMQAMREEQEKESGKVRQIKAQSNHHTKEAYELIPSGMNPE
jgi:hypothetical protein